MKITFLILLALGLTTCFGQNHNLALGVSNNGQLSQSTDEFYFDFHNMSVFFYPGRVLQREESSFKATAEYSYRLENGLEFGLIGGFGQRKDSYVTDVGKVKASQQYMSLLPLVLKSWEVRSLQFSLGGGIPFHIAGGFKAAVSEYYQPLNISTSSNNSLEGGYAVGLSAIGRIKWLFTPKLSLMATASFGALYTSFGGDYTVSYTSTHYPPDFILRDRKQTGFTLPAPELSIGIGFRI